MWLILYDLSYLKRSFKMFHIDAPHENIRKRKGTLSGLRQFLVTESFLEMMKNAFDFALEALFILEIFIFILTFRSCTKMAWYEIKCQNFKTYDVTKWITNNYNKHIARYLGKKGSLITEFGQWKIMHKMWWRN